jgi:hypothetical protein
LDTTKGSQTQQNNEINKKRNVPDGDALVNAAVRLKNELPCAIDKIVQHVAHEVIVLQNLPNNIAQIRKSLAERHDQQNRRKKTDGVLISAERW